MPKPAAEAEAAATAAAAAADTCKLIKISLRDSFCTGWSFLEAFGQGGTGVNSSRVSYGQTKFIGASGILL